MPVTASIASMAENTLAAPRGTISDLNQQIAASRLLASNHQFALINRPHRTTQIKELNSMGVLMLAKIGFVIAGTALAIFAMGRVESLAAHHGFIGSQAWAQQWDDSSGDSSPAADSESKSTPPDVAGTYSGSIKDHRFGAGTITATIDQTGSKLSGTANSSFGGGTLKGKVSSKGTIQRG